MSKDPDRPGGGGGPAVSSDEPLADDRPEPSYVPAPCPVCGAADASLRTVALTVPYFGELFESVFLCPACGFRHADTLLPRIQEPTEFTLRIEGERDLFVRAVKSSSATVSLPELGLLWEPGPASVAKVTNVEGLVQHFEEAVARARTLFPEPAAQARADELEGKLAAVREGKQPVTLVVKDPYGNSALIGDTDRIARRTLPPEEASSLATGEYVVESSPDGHPKRLRHAGG